MNQNQKIILESENMSFQITNTVEPNFALRISKIFLKNFKQVDIHALGSLQQICLATIQKIETMTEIFEEGYHPKIIVSLRVTDNGLQILNNQNFNMNFI